ncbi:UCH-domain-containing protein [Amniculicola lignicola CBS 123094]|uniref:ubiquitinyl hydrolase 1 n=1 Tax=Amniculicola lignicola CBS 123094 TaxID=1392246 RepID=A0A6A5WCV4_9PLEO|nr:UCH-domain-containing protein [Amniculicola lignicola CBS 123094]
MDPESSAFQPRDDYWRLQSEMLRVQQSQSELDNRVSRLERRHEDDSRLKNVWGTSSPFPSVLGGTPQQVPLQQPTAQHFSHFDDHSSNLIGNLQLDADEEPRRVGATSRANSVRFDETANHGHWAHASRSSLDLIARTGSGMGGHLMSERSYSHKSDGRQSSAGQSVHSATSGRANSLTGYGLATSAEPPGLAPGLFILGSVPAIIRCWLNTNFKHDSLLYAAICSGSYASYLDFRLIERLGFEDQITKSDDGTPKIKLAMYLPEAVPLSASSRSGSPAPQLPTLHIEFTVVEGKADDKSIQIFLGSDMLRAHNADILLSSNQLTLYDEDRSKLQIPLVRPEDDRTFKCLFITSGSLTEPAQQTAPEKDQPSVPKAASADESLVPTSTAAHMASKVNGGTPTNGSDDGGSSGRPSLEQRPFLAVSTNRPVPRDGQEASPASAAPRSGSSPAIWSNWRRDAEKSNSMDWTNVGKDSNTGATYQRKDTGIKVLKPTRSGTTRTLSTSISHSSSPSVTGQSRFFGDTNRRASNAGGSETSEPQLKRAVSGEKVKENLPTIPKARPTNPVGGASAFAWLNSGSNTRQGPSQNLHHDANPTPNARPPLQLLLSRTARLPQFPRRSAVFSGPRHTLSFTSPPFCLALELNRLHRQAPSFTTASTKKRKIAPANTRPRDASADASAAQQSPHERGGIKSPRSSPLPPASSLRSSASPPPPRYLPPHMHDEVFEAAQDSASVSKDHSTSTASSPSDAYANLTLESRETNGTMGHDAEDDARSSTAKSDPPPPRPPPRSSSPAKRLHSDMDDSSKEPMDVDTPPATRRASDHGSPRTTKPLPVAAQRSLRATSVEMVDASTNGGSAEGSDTTSLSNQDSAATSLSAQESPRPAENVPSLDEQVATVMLIMNRPLSEGDEGYVLSEKWLERVWARTSENEKRPEQFNKDALEGEIGEIDNSDLVDQAATVDDLADQNGEDFIPLRPGQSIGHEFEVLPQEAWDKVVKWYGLKHKTPVIRRYAHNTALDEFSENYQYELYPPIFTVRKLQKSGVKSQDPPKSSPRLVASRSDGYQEFLKAAKKAADINMTTKVQVWRVLKSGPTEPLSQPNGILTPESSPRNGSPTATPQEETLPLLIDLAAFNNLVEGSEREMVTGKDETANEKYNGHMNLQIAGLAEDQVLILEEQDSKGIYLSETSQKATIKNGVLSKSNMKNKGLQSGANSGRNSPAPSGPITRGRTRTGGVKGKVGLTNLGNTCYMNSALQCIRSVEELSLYFLEGNYKVDINADNPLGHNGAIAKAYAGLITQIYASENTSFSPKNFKFTLGRAQPLFSGYGQQDSQEFLSFLVDGLHEDLNRVKKKPYTENPESDDKTVHDPEAIKALGEKYREIHHARNDSVAMDLFSGFYKNTMVCPDCEKVSITFDPYSLVTLQLPVEQSWQHTIRFVPLYGKMVDVEVDIDKNASIKGLKEYIAKRFPGVKASRLMGSEVYSHKFYRVLENDKSIAECNIGQRDDIWFFELDNIPTNWPPKKKPNKYRSMIYPLASSEEDIPESSSPLADRMLVPIFHRGQSVSQYRGTSMSLVMWPSYIVVTREEAKDYDSILRKVLGKVAQMTTRDILSEFTSAPPSDQSRSGSDVVVTTEEDASPDSDPRVHDGSVEGEDNMVEVTMSEPVATPADHVVEEATETLPEILRPGSFIPPEYRTLFDLKHTRKGREIVPTGWSSVDSNKSYELIESRIRVQPSRQSSVSMANSNASTSDEDEIPQFSADVHSSVELANQSSEDESVEPSSFVRGGRQKKQTKKERRQQKKKAQKTYSKKGKDRFPADQPSQSFTDLEEDEEDLLLRLGEGIVLDWNPQAFNALFEGTNEEDERGIPTIKTVETLDDPELKAKMAKRLARKKNGITLEECFAETSKSEVLSEDNAWYCGRCKELRRATKTLEIWTAPDILVLHLKRFSSHRSFRDKIEALIDFPVEGLDLSGKVGLPEDKSLVYDLFAVDNHFGGLGGGHYTAYAQNFFDKKWYNYNDSSVSAVNNPEKVITSAAYLLFYRRRTATPLGPRYLQEIVNKVMDPDSEGSTEDESVSRAASPAGNGSRLVDSSRNGSSSASLAVAAGAQRAGGSTSAGTLVRNAAAVEIVDEDEEMEGVEEPLPGYDDEGYGGAEDDEMPYPPVDINELYRPLYNNSPGWGWDDVTRGNTSIQHDGDDASDAPNLGSEGDDDLAQRMREDFGDDVGDEGLLPGRGTPLEMGEEEVPSLLRDEVDEVADVLLDEDEEVGVGAIKV